MTLLKSQLLHLGLLGVAGVLALSVWTRDDDAKLDSQSTQVEVWGGGPDSVTAVSYESSARKVRLEPRKDALGRWYVGTVEKDEPAVPPNPHGAGGAPASEPATTKHTTTRFVAVKAADDLLKSLAPLRALRAAGARVGLGVDGSASNDGSHLLAEARQALLLHRLAGDPAGLTALEALRLATRGGAAVLGRDDIGQLAPGKRADLAVWRTDGLEFGGAEDLVCNLVVSGPHRVDRLVVGGRDVVRGGALVNAREDEIAREHRVQAARLWAA